MTLFGTHLREIRNRCNDPQFIGRRLSQERLGELLGRELGMHAGFSGAAVSDWERGKSKIHADNRRVLISLLFILREAGGIKTIAEANALLEVGNYRALNPAETEKVFRNISEAVGSQSQPGALQGSTSNTLEELLFIPNLQTSLEKAKEGPEPAWPRMIVAGLRFFLDRWTVLHSLKALLWFWIWLFAWGLMTPSLHWPFSSREDAISVLRLYVGGTIAIPPLIGLLTDTKNNVFWQEHNLAIAPVTRLYTHQGAFIGFHLGYFVAFVIALIRYYLHHEPTILFDLTVMSFPLVVGYMGARLVPFNLWQAYERLSLSDGEVFFFFVIFGPLWGFMFLEIYPYLLNPAFGAMIILLALTTLITLTAWQYRRKGTTVIPYYWWLIFFGFVLACQIAVLFIQ